MVNILWREGWLKPLSTESLPTEKCSLCKDDFKELEFVTSCEFCDIGILHDDCCRIHIIKDHKESIDQKVKAHEEKRLHSYQ
ncbi:hypothetical protein [Candidatus Nitrosocosmicus arcticus]|uniref:hypothetical protein n=1 Tax=Candidatus Nitrosocosmicus arcticus TaxID=2035267 RepID=UPI0011A21E19|nr:hypothetical protein [Candidatus Nitrosocosmicus arcticus]